jgi:hypothetical protein
VRLRTLRSRDHPRRERYLVFAVCLFVSSCWLIGRRCCRASARRAGGRTQYGSPVGCRFAATGFGIMMGAINRTTEQSSVFCATAVVIAAALGGIMVPSFLMPARMQQSAALAAAVGLSAFVDSSCRRDDRHRAAAAREAGGFGAVTLGSPCWSSAEGIAP